MRNDKIEKCLGLRGPLPTAKKRDKVNAVKILTRIERQQFWSKVILDEDEQMRARLKASELLGRSNADFVEKVQLDINHTFSVAQAIEQADVRSVETIEQDSTIDIDQLPSSE